MIGLRSKRILATAFLVALVCGLSFAEEGIDARIAAAADRAYPDLVTVRRWFHEHPELSNRETGTGAEIARRLRALGLEVHDGVAGHGVVAIIRGALPGPVVAWRADIDALPIEEQVDVPYRSVTPGVMHACGHDVHITVGLGVAKVLTELRDSLHGTVKLIFQPAEEGPPPGEPGGAPLMIAQGVLEDPAPQAIFGLHVTPSLPEGMVGVRAGGLMAAADRFTITVHGKMAHGSAPQESVDAVVAAAQVVTALQTIASREIDPRAPVVVSVGRIAGGQRFNIIADKVELEGTVRTLDEATHEAVPAAMKRIVDNTCGAMRATCEVDYRTSTLVTRNTPALAEFAAATLSAALGSGQVMTPAPIMAAEDFSYYLQKVPGVYLFLGVGNTAEGWTAGLHTAHFRPDERAIRTGVVTAATLLAHYTAEHPDSGTSGGAASD